MKVHLKQIPAAGIHLEGKEETDILELGESQVRPLGPVEYSLDIGISESGLFVTGEIEVDVRRSRQQLRWRLLRGHPDHQRRRSHHREPAHHMAPQTRHQTRSP